LFIESSACLPWTKNRTRSSIR